MKDPNENFLKTFEFKGIEIKPLSYARKASILGLLANPSAPTFTDIPTFIYGTICLESELIHARRKPEAFDVAVNRWMDQVKYQPEDVEAAGQLIRELLENSEADKAQPMEDVSLASDPNY